MYQIAGYTVFDFRGGGSLTHGETVITLVFFGFECDDFCTFRLQFVGRVFQFGKEILIQQHEIIGECRNFFLLEDEMVMGEKGGHELGEVLHGVEVDWGVAVGEWPA